LKWTRVHNKNNLQNGPDKLWRVNVNDGQTNRSSIAT